MVADKDVVGGRLLAELAQHAHDLAAMESGVIDDMEQELPARDAPVNRVEFQRKSSGGIHAPRILSDEAIYQESFHKKRAIDRLWVSFLTLRASKDLSLVKAASSAKAGGRAVRNDPILPRS